VSDDYNRFFEKLKNYNKDPEKYIGNDIRYDDFVDQRESFNDTNLPGYINKFTFAEDLAYHRYNPLLIDLWNTNNNERISTLTKNLANLTGAS
jgi:hypothetical protein